jgi:hypothetical protein
MDQPIGEVCYENIGPKERAKRAKSGYVMLAVAGVLAVGLLALGADWWWRLLVFFPLVAAFNGWLQARERT